MNSQELSFYAISAFVSSLIAIVIGKAVGIIWGMQIGGSIAFIIYLYMNDMLNLMHDYMRALDAIYRRWLNSPPHLALGIAACIIPTLVAVMIYKLMPTLPFIEVYAVLIGHAALIFVTNQTKGLL